MLLDMRQILIVLIGSSLLLRELRIKCFLEEILAWKRQNSSILVM